MFGWRKRGTQAAPPNQVTQEAPAAPAESLRARGKQFLSQDRYADAAECLAQAVELEPGHAASRVNLGFALCELHRHGEAIGHLQRAAALEPANHDAFYLLGLAQERVGALQEAAGSFEAAAKAAPDFAAVYGDWCRVLLAVGNYSKAASAAAAGVALSPQAPETHFYSGQAQAGLGNLDAAAQALRQALTLAPAAGELHAALGSVLQRQGLLAQARACYEQALLLDPGNAAAHSDLGEILRVQGSLAEALACVDRAVALQPGLAAAHNNKGAVHLAMGDARHAIACFDKVLELTPGSSQALGNRAAALAALGSLVEALEANARAVAMDGASAGPWIGQGNTLVALLRHADALASFDAALERDARSAPAHGGRAMALHALGRLGAALESYQAATALSPRDAVLLNNRGTVEAEMGNLPAAVASYDLSIAADPAYAQAWFNRGSALRNGGRMDEALASYAQALVLQPGMPFLYGNWLHLKMQACDWEGLDAQFAAFARRVDESGVFNPFTAIATPMTAARQKTLAQNYARHMFKGSRAAVQARPAGGRIRIGYFSADLHEHATAFLMAQLFEKHDRTRFELFAFSFGPTAPSTMRQRLERAFDHFLVVNTSTDAEVAALARKHGIDIAVDLKGYTQHSRPAIFAAGAAPIQVSYLGYPGTMGATFIDYLIADHVVVEETDLGDYAEKIAFLPGSYQVNDGSREIAQQTPGRAALGLPDEGFVFCCFNNNYKITPVIFDVWMRLLQAVPGSVLWLLDGSPQSKANLRKEALARGVAAERLVFAPRMDLPSHLARHRHADLFLDTVFCNAHTTASDALWAGLPVLTCHGHTFAGRVAESLLHALDLPDLAAPDLQTYETVALRLAQDGQALDSVRSRLEHARRTAPLFNAQAFAHNLEALFGRMVERQAAGLAPDHLAAG